MVVGAAACWASLGVLGKLAFATGMGPASVVLFRALTAVALLALVLAGFDRAALRLPVRSVPLFLGLGMGLALSSSAFFHGVQHLDVGVAISLFYLYPALVALIARAALGEALTRRKAVALAVSLIGCALVAGRFEGARSVSGIGIVLSLVAAGACAVYTVLVKVAVRDHPPTRTTVYSLVFALPFLGLAGIVGGEPLQPPGTAAAWGLVVLLAVVPTLAGYTLLAIALRFIESSRASIVATLEPVLATLLALGVLGERLRSLQGVGILLIVAGAILAQAERTGKPAPSIPP